jgi:methionyl-tRNA formyltransferase
MNKNIFYIGYEPKTLSVLINNYNVNVCSVSKLDILDLKTSNPINIFFYLLYNIREKNFKKLKFIESFLYIICNRVYGLTTGVYKRYGQYILNLSKYEIEIWNLNNKNIEFKIKNNIDLILVNVWGLLDKKIYKSPKIGSVNIHPSILPKNIGAIPTLWSLKNREKESAVSYVFITEKGIDTGDIIFQQKFDIKSSYNIVDVEKIISKIIFDTLNNVIESVIQNNFVLLKQDLSKITKTAKYEDYKEIKPSIENSADILNKILGYPYVIYGEYCYIYHKNKRIQIKNANHFNYNYFNFKIKCSDGIIIYARYFKDINFINSFILLFKS